VPVRWIDEVLDIALERPLAPANTKSASVAIGDAVESKADTDPPTVRAH